MYDIGRGEARILVGAEQSGGAWWLGKFRNDPGRLTSLHVHHSADEQFYALEGVIFRMGGWQLARPTPGGPCVVPQGTPHALGNRTKQAVRFLNSGNPAGFERFFATAQAEWLRPPEWASHSQRITPCAFVPGKFSGRQTFPCRITEGLPVIRSKRRCQLLCGVWP